MSMFICEAQLCFQFTKTLKNWNLEKVYLVVCGCLLVVCGCLLVVCGRLLVVCGGLLVACGRLLVVCCCLLVVTGRLWSFVGSLWWFAVVYWWFVVVCGRLLVVCCRLLVVCGRLWSLPVLVTTNYGLLFIFCKIAVGGKKEIESSYHYFRLNRYTFCLCNRHSHVQSQ